MSFLPTRLPDVGPRTCTIGLLALLLLVVPEGAAEEDPLDRLRYGFTGAIGYGRATGAARDVLDDTWSADFNVFLEKGRFRGGIGYEFRFRTLEPARFEEVSAAPFNLYGAFSPWPKGRVRPYLQARLGLTRWTSCGGTMGREPIRD